LGIRATLPTPRAGVGKSFLDVPSINRDAIALAQDLGLKLSVTRS
jgi:hypothetical protein